MKVALFKNAVVLAAVMFSLIFSSAVSAQSLTSPKITDFKKARADIVAGVGSTAVVLIRNESTVADHRQVICIGERFADLSFIKVKPGVRLNCNSNGKFTSPDIKIVDMNAVAL